MAKVKCAICGKEGSSRKLYHCSNCGIWVHYKCADSSGQIISTYKKCPNCGKKLSKD